MRHLFCLTSGVLLLIATAASPAFADDARIGGMQLLSGYTHQPLQGFDSIVGKVSKKDGLQISYDIGSIPKPGGLAFGGQFSDRAKKTQKNQLHWYKEQVVNGQPMHVAHRKDGYLLLTFPKKGINFSAKVASTEDVAEVLLMILTYPNPVAKKTGKAAPAGKK
jgi:hypothetical protein